MKSVNADPAFALGELELKKQEILARLVKDSLLKPNKRLAVPVLSQKIGLITSKGSAACNDILKTFSSSGFGFKIFLADSVMQGGKTEESVLSALDVLEEISIDLLIIARGGGSKTDLSYLDNEQIARRIAGYRYPVWTGIGHEIDTSILDHVANRYFKTPTAVAEDIVARFVEMKRHLEESENRFRSTWTYRYDIDKKRLNDAKTGILQGTRKLLDATKSYLLGYATTLSAKLQTRLTSENSKIAVSKNLISTASINLIQREVEKLSDKSDRLISGCLSQTANSHKELWNLKKRFRADRFISRLQHEQQAVQKYQKQFLFKFNSEMNFCKQQMTQFSRRFKIESVIKYIGNEKTKLAAKAATLRAADPVTSLKRGFSLVHAENGDLVKSISRINVADRLETQVSDGRIISTVDKTERKSDG